MDAVLHVWRESLKQAVLFIALIVAACGFNAVAWAAEAVTVGPAVPATRVCALAVQLDPVTV